MASVMLKQMLIVKLNSARYINTPDILNTTGDWDFLIDSSCRFFQESASCYLVSSIWSPVLQTKSFQRSGSYFTHTPCARAVLMARWLRNNHEKS